VNSYLNFKVDIILSVEKIIASAFANPDRRKFEFCEAFGKYPLFPESLSQETVMHKIISQIPTAVS